MDSPDRPRLNVPARPFPWQALDSLGRLDSVRLAQVRRFVAGAVDLPRFRARLAEMAGERAFFRLRSFGPARPSDPTALAVKLTRGGVDVMVVEAEAALAAALVRRAIAGSKSAAAAAKKPMSVARPASHEIAAAFAAVMAHALRHSAATGTAAEPLRIAAFGGARTVAPLGDPLRAETTWRALAFTVRLGDEAFVGRVLVPNRETANAAPIALDRARLRALGRTPLSVPIVAAVVQMSRSELAALSLGDALLVSPASPGSAASLRPPPCVGPVWLAGAHRETGCRAEIAADGRLVLRGTLDEADPDFPSEPNEESAMAGSDAAHEAEHNEASEADEHDARGQADSLLAALGDAPVVVRVEIGVAQMAAREWAELGPGDVVALGRRIAEPVILRVAGREVARGELVDLEGEIGVRIMSRGEE